MKHYFYPHFCNTLECLIERGVVINGGGYKILKNLTNGGFGINEGLVNS